MNCKNKHCSNPANDSKVCPYCCKVMYCSDKCLKLDWETHKFSCTPRVFLLKDFIPIKNSHKSLLGKGAYGEVQLVQHARSKLLYALKIIKKGHVNHHAPVEIFLREISIHKALIHPNISRLYDHLEDKHKFYLILEYVEKGSMYNLLKKKIKLEEKEACELFRQTCIGVHFLHENKIIHRDIKSENLLISREGVVKICDFGWCAFGTKPRVTFCGTADYMAPEMAQSESYNHKVDVWALGILLFELVHGRPPYLGLPLFEKIEQITSSDLPLKSSLSEALKSLLNLILNKDPDERPEVKDLLKHSWFSDNMPCLLRVGTILKHPEYGEGIVLATQGCVCLINFGKCSVELIDSEVLRVAEVRNRRGSVTRSQDIKGKCEFNLNGNRRSKTLVKTRNNKGFRDIRKIESALNSSAENLAWAMEGKEGHLDMTYFGEANEISIMSHVNDKRIVG